MAVILREGSIFGSELQTLVCPVNCVGVMGSGLAKQFKDYMTPMYEEYKELCDRKLFGIGILWLWKDEMETRDKRVLCFPTKIHYIKKSEYWYLYQGLEKFVKTYEEKGITSIAFPLLGCGKEGLEPKHVIPIMKQYLDPLPIPVEIWVPSEIASNPYI